MNYRLVPRPWLLLKYRELYPMLEQIVHTPELSVFVPLNGEPVKRVRGTIRKGMWKRGMRMVSTYLKEEHALKIWPMETDLEVGLPLAEARGRRWEVIRAEAPTRPHPVLAAPFLAWDPVTTGTDGLPLGPGLEVTEYRVYRCGPSATGPCSTPDRILAGTVPAPATQFDLAGQAVPQAFVATAVNKVGESADSLKFKVTPPDMPKNLRLP